MTLARVTLQDLARAAGVSPATVDRVLNERGGVHPRTRDLVLTAARRMGVVPEGEAAPPAADPTARSLRPLRLVFVLPAGTNSFIKVLRAQVEAQAAARPDLRVGVDAIEGLDPERLAAHLEALAPDVQGIGLVALDHPAVREAIRGLARRGVAVVTVASDVQNVPRVAYVGTNNLQAGRVAGHLMGRLLGDRPDPQVALLAGSLGYRGHGERELGFRAVLAEDFPAVRVVAAREMGDDRDRARAEAGRLLDAHPALSGLYNVGGGNVGIGRALREREVAGKLLLIGHEATDGNKRMLLDRTMDAVIDQNPRVEAREALNALAASIRGEPYVVVPPRLSIVLRENLPEE